MKLYHGSYVSVPLRGLWFLSVEPGTTVNMETGEFPSPCGDYGSYQGISPLTVPWLVKFPSPCGDYGSYHRSG